MKKTLLLGLISGTIMLIASLFLNFILRYIFPAISSQYENIALFRPWSDPLMSLYFLYPFVLGIFLAVLWNKTSSVFKNGFGFGCFYWIAASVPGMFITYSTFQVSFLMVASWSLNGLIQAVIAGIVLEKLSKKTNV